MTAARPQPKERPATVPWRAVALPVEHGGWGFLVEPLVLGLVLAPSAAGACLALAAAAGFLARHPLRLWLLDRRKHVRYPRTALAERVFAGYALVGLVFLAARPRAGAVAVLAASCSPPRRSGSWLSLSTRPVEAARPCPKPRGPSRSAPRPRRSRSPAAPGPAWPGAPGPSSRCGP